ncbi:hypothetical protein LE181_12580 [Streptomyces sp. SCA3-4]|uniref:hypothetical protein n=1 Tax=Streptomyces sichuanensis TaxID=2871810 RepID=UPI001CE33D4A|nr:hypothetical protein [Streptomyces sichuanensis]MCA6092993.1 hypothetical protein [Streptomyces sichuanensis]
MNAIRTTPPRPLDVAAVFPQLAPLARTATRLHPRPGAPSLHDSSIGGPLLWPADEPWPHCDAPHQGGGYSLIEVRAERRARARRAMYPDGAPDVPHYTPEEEAALAEIDWDAELPDGPVPMLPLAQFYVRDIPLLRPPGQADLLQVLWCPFDHEPMNMPRTALFWRSAAAVTDVLTSPPEWPVVEFEEYVPVPCVLAPEQVTEYPNSLELSEELREQLKDWSRWQAADAGVDSSYAPYPESYYHSHLSVAPGWKVGGWPQWGYTDPVPRLCPACDTEMDALLTIATFEWDGGNRSWIPEEDRAAASSRDDRYRDLCQPTAVQIASGHKQQLYICPAAPEHPHMELMQ